MISKLNSFYKDCMLPKIVDRRLPRGLRKRDHAKIIEAQYHIKKKINCNKKQ